MEMISSNHEGLQRCLDATFLEHFGIHILLNVFHELLEDYRARLAPSHLLVESLLSAISSFVDGIPGFVKDEVTDHGAGLTSAGLQRH